jgi:ATP-binding cassette subfamily B protein
MRPSVTSSPALPEATVPAPAVSDWHTLARLFPYLWEYKWRVMAALSFMVGAKLANVGVPILLKNLIDQMTPQPTGVQVLLVVPVALLIGYGLLRLSVSAFTELR